MITLETPDTLIAEAAKYGAKIKKRVQYNPESPLLEVSAQFNGEEYCPEGADADFGFSLNPMKVFKKNVTKPLINKMAAKEKDPIKKAKILSLHNAKFKVNVKESAIGLGKGVATGVAIASMAVPGVGTAVGAGALGALGAANKYLKGAKKITSFNIPKNVDPKRALASADKLLGSTKIAPVVKQQVINNTKAMAALGDPNAKRALTTLNVAQQIRTAAQVPIGKPAIKDAKPLPTKIVKKEQPKSKVIQLAQKADANLKTLGIWARFKNWLLGEKK